MANGFQDIAPSTPQEAIREIVKEGGRRGWSAEKIQSFIQQQVSASPGSQRTDASTSMNEINKNIEDNPLSTIGSSPKEDREGRSGLAGFLVGAGKGVASSISGASELGQKGLEVATRPLRRLFGDKDRPEVARLSEGLTTPEGGAEKAGFATEQIAEFFVPSGAIFNTVKAATKASKAGKTVTFLSQALSQAAAGGATTAVQEGEVGEEAAKTAAISGATGGLGSAFRGVLKSLAPRFEKATQSLLKKTIVEKGAQIEQNVAKYKDLSDDMLKLLKKGELDVSSTQALQRQSDQSLNIVNGKIGELLDKIKPGALIKKKITQRNISKRIGDAVEDRIGIGAEEAKHIKDINKIITGQGRLDGQKLNKLKIKFATRAFKGTDETKKSVYTEAHGQLMKLVETLDDTVNIKSLNETHNIWRQIQAGAIGKARAAQQLTQTGQVSAVGTRSGLVERGVGLVTPSAGKLAPVALKVSERLEQAGIKDQRILKLVGETLDQILKEQD